MWVRIKQMTQPKGRLWYTVVILYDTAATGTTGMMIEKKYFFLYRQVLKSEAHVRIICVYYHERL